ncbi:unnamed protein product [Mytilus coruscus]|uniref:Uncharacterized protein n=1 Tax=Mytilus coruscus TaxID=42192 RepID=A0A6J8DF30_MYTCO|nr:unnamed protein product [Mytilus coruscus]
MRILHHMVLAKSKFSASNSLYEQFGLSRNITRRVKRGEDILNKERKKRKDAVSEEEVNHIQEFYKMAYVSREMPNMNVIKKDLSVKMPLEGSLKRTYDQYNNENPEKKISYAKFAQLRPKNVLPMSKQKYRQCLCEYCINVDFKIESLKSFCSVHKIDNIATDRYDLSRLTLCPKEGNYYKKDCIDRNCGNCGLTKIDDAVTELIENFKDTQVGWKRWQQGHKESEVNGKQVVKTFMEMKRRSGTMEQLIDEMKSELLPFSKHLFNAQWQSKQFEDLKAHIHEKWVLMCLDFAENYICRHQDEAQSAHWTYEQVTIHPLVTYYQCQEENCHQTVRESLVFISQDHKHDYHMVHHCIVKANTYLLEHLDEIRKQVQFSDGAPTQYKSKYNFVDMSFWKDDFGFEVEKHFFGSRHGKDPCDGESGVAKRSATVAVAARGCIISNAQDFYLYAKKQLSLPKENDVEQHIHSKRTFFFIKSGDVDRNRPERTLRIKTLKQSRSLFSYREIQPYVTTARERSCFCHICIGQAIGVCQFEKLTGEMEGGQFEDPGTTSKKPADR